MKRYSPQLNLRIEPELKEWVERKAKTDERSQTWLVNHILKEAMRRDQQKTAQK